MAKMDYSYRKTKLSLILRDVIFYRPPYMEKYFFWIQIKLYTIVAGKKAISITYYGS